MVRKRALCCGMAFSVLMLPKPDQGSPVPGNDPVKRMFSAGMEKRKNAIALSPKQQKAVYYSTVTFAEESVPLDAPEVEAKFEKYLANFSFPKQQSYDLHRKATKHLPKIASILQLYGVPEDFKYVPLIESDMDPATLSHKGAGGYWQFMPATARLYGLKVDDEVDERIDLVKSTHAAARYLKNLYAEFNDWTLVAAAYNLGENRLRSAIRRQGTSDYYRLRLNPETGAYVYKLLSVKQVIENPNKHGYKRYARTEDKYREHLL